MKKIILLVLHTLWLIVEPVALFAAQPFFRLRAYFEGLQPKLRRQMLWLTCVFAVIALAWLAFWAPKAGPLTLLVFGIPYANQLFLAVRDRSQALEQRKYKFGLVPANWQVKRFLGFIPYVSTTPGEPSPGRPPEAAANDEQAVKPRRFWPFRSR